MLQYGLIIAGLAALAANWVGNVPPHLLIPATALPAVIFTLTKRRPLLPSSLIMLIGGLSVWTGSTAVRGLYAPVLAFEAARGMGKPPWLIIAVFAAAEVPTVMRWGPDALVVIASVVGAAGVRWAMRNIVKERDVAVAEIDGLRDRVAQLPVDPMSENGLTREAISLEAEMLVAINAFGSILGAQKVRYAAANSPELPAEGRLCMDGKSRIHRNTVYAPVRHARGGPFGVLVVEEARKGPEKEILKTATECGRLLGAVVARWQILRETERKGKTYEMLKDEIASFKSTLNPQDIVGKLGQGIVKVVPDARGVLVEAMGVSYVAGASARSRLENLAQTAGGGVGRRPRRDEALVLQLTNDKPWGVVVDADLSQAQTNIIEALVAHGGAMLSNAHLHKEMERLAMHDGLTGLYNRRTFVEVMEREAMRSERSGEPLCFLLLDADHFKKINDTHGHDIGDKVLREIARLVSGSVRSVDTCGRLGGEEFGVVLPGATQESGLKVAEKIRREVEMAGLVLESGVLKVTASIGLATRLAGEGEGVDSVLKRADRALYRAKDEGRNQVVAADVCREKPSREPKG